MSKKRRASFNQLPSSTHPLHQQKLRPVPAPMKKKQREFLENQDFDLLAQLESIGLEKVIAQQNTSEQGYNYKITPAIYGNQENLKMSTDLDFEQDDFFDYSNINLKLEKSSNKIKEEIMNKMRVYLQEIRNKVAIPKQEILKMRLGLIKLFSEMKSAFLETQNSIKQKIKSFIMKENHQRPVFSNQNQEADELKKQLNKNQQYINKLQNDKIKLMEQINQLKKSKSNEYNQLFIQNIELKNRVTDLEKVNKTLLIQTKEKKLKEEYFQGNMASSFTQNQIYMKQKHVMVIQKFSEEIEKLENQLAQMRESGEEQVQCLLMYRQSLEKQQSQIYDIVSQLQERELQIQQKQLQLQLKAETLQSWESQMQLVYQSRMRSNRSRKTYRPSILNEQQWRRDNIWNNERGIHRSRRETSRTMGRNSRICLGSCLSADMMHLQKQVSPIGKKNLNIFSIKRDSLSRRLKGEGMENNRLSRQISNIQLSIKKQLNQMGYGY